MPDLVVESERTTPVLEEVDVLVVGGGPSGVGAAVGAARAGARTMIIERLGFLGGNWTAGMVLTLAGYNSWLQPYARCVKGVGEEWLQRATELEGAEDNESFVLNSDPEIMKLVADELITESGVIPMFHTWVADVLMEDGTVQGVLVENVEGRGAIRAKVTVDCTGNGDLLARSGAEWVKGQNLQPMTMPFRMGFDSEEPSEAFPPVVLPIGPDRTLLTQELATMATRRDDILLDRDDMRRRFEAGELPLFGGPWFGGLDRDVVWFNATRINGDASKVSDLTSAEIEGRRASARIAAYFRDHVPGFSGSRILETSTVMGIRETRRLVGRHVLTEEEVVESRQFDDAIAVGCWPVDIHPADGSVSGAHRMMVPEPYGIPYGALLPRNVEGLLTAGRCISTTREALGSTRVGATCVAVGHAAGVAGAMASRSGVKVGDVDPVRLRGELTDQGALVDPPGGAG